MAHGVQQLNATQLTRPCCLMNLHVHDVLSQWFRISRQHIQHVANCFSC